MILSPEVRPLICNFVYVSHKSVSVCFSETPSRGEALSPAHTSHSPEPPSSSTGVLSPPSRREEASERAGPIVPAALPALQPPSRGRPRPAHARAYLGHTGLCPGRWHWCPPRPHNTRAAGPRGEMAVGFQTLGLGGSCGPGPGQCSQRGSEQAHPKAQGSGLFGSVSGDCTLLTWGELRTHGCDARKLPGTALC